MHIFRSSGRKKSPEDNNVRRPHNRTRQGEGSSGDRQRVGDNPSDTVGILAVDWLVRLSLAEGCLVRSVTSHLSSSAGVAVDQRRSSSPTIEN